MGKWDGTWTCAFCGQKYLPTGSEWEGRPICPTCFERRWDEKITREGAEWEAGQARKRQERRERMEARKKAEADASAPAPKRKQKPTHGEKK